MSDSERFQKILSDWMNGMEPRDIMHNAAMMKQLLDDVDASGAPTDSYVDISIPANMLSFAMTAGMIVMLREVERRVARVSASITAGTPNRLEGLN